MMQNAVILLKEQFTQQDQGNYKRLDNDYYNDVCFYHKIIITKYS
jgi:hypothetical protein